jgi:hypothetical protein
LDDALAMKMHCAFHDRGQRAQGGSFSAKHAKVRRLESMARQVNYGAEHYNCCSEEYTGAQQIADHDLNSAIIQGGVCHSFPEKPL